MLERMKERKERRGEGGFTLIELLIVIIILAILAAIVVFAVGTTGKNAAVAACQSTVKSVETAVEAYHAQLTAYPTTFTDLTTKQATPGHPTTAARDVGPWLRSAPTTSTKYTIVLGTGTTAGKVLVKAPPSATAKDYDTTPAACTAA